MSSTFPKVKPSLVASVALALLQFPVCALLADLMQNFERSHFAKMGVFQYLFFTAFGAIPIGLAWMLFFHDEIIAESTRMICVCKRIAFLVILLLSYTTATFGILQIHTDAQAAIVLVVMPFFVAFLAMVLAGVILLIKRITKS